MAKGSQFERDVCRDLSLWWTEGERDDVFWRSSNSGGRATVRGRKGKRTHGQAGDIAATDPIGGPLLRLLTIEAKRGYSSQTLADLVDRPRKAAQQTWESWIQQAHEAHVLSDSFSWMIVAQRDRRERIVLMDGEAWLEIANLLTFSKPVCPFLQLLLRCRFKHPEGEPAYTTRKIGVVGMRWNTWCELVHPDVIRLLAKRLL